MPHFTGRSVCRVSNRGLSFILKDSGAKWMFAKTRAWTWLLQLKDSCLPPNRNNAGSSGIAANMGRKENPWPKCKRQWKIWHVNVSSLCFSNTEHHQSDQRGIPQFQPGSLRFVKGNAPPSCLFFLSSRQPWPGIPTLLESGKWWSCVICLDDDW